MERGGTSTPSSAAVRTMMSQGTGPNLSLLSRPATRSAVIQQWLTAMRDRGIIISDAQMRYRRWLAMSETDRPLSPTSGASNSHQKSSLPTGGGSDKLRPLTAPAAFGTYLVEHTKTSRLRLEKLKEPKAEADYNALAKKKRQFNRQCHTISATPVKMENCAGDDVTMYEFLVGSRYNCSRHIDSRSLYRLGVYVPRENVSSAFINPGGILPPAEYARRNRRRKLLSKGTTKNTIPYSSFFDETKSNLTARSSLESQTLPSLDNRSSSSCQSSNNLVTKSDGEIAQKLPQQTIELERPTTQNEPPLRTMNLFDFLGSEECKAVYPVASHSDSEDSELDEVDCAITEQIEKENYLKLVSEKLQDYKERQEKEEEYKKRMKEESEKEEKKKVKKGNSKKEKTIKEEIKEEKDTLREKEDKREKTKKENKEIEEEDDRIQNVISRASNNSTATLIIDMTQIGNKK